MDEINEFLNKTNGCHNWLSWILETNGSDRRASSNCEISTQVTGLEGLSCISDSDQYTAVPDGIGVIISKAIDIHHHPCDKSL